MNIPVNLVGAVGVRVYLRCFTSSEHPAKASGPLSLAVFHMHSVKTSLQMNL